VRVESKWSLAYEHDLLMAFWLAVHKEDVVVVSALIDWDPSLRYVSALAIKRRRERKPRKKKDKKKLSVMTSSIP